MLILPYFVDVVFFIMLGLFLYFNIVAQNNFLKSNVIIVKANDPTCNENPEDLPDIDITDLVACKDVDDEYIYSVENTNLKFIVTTERSHAGNANFICKHYCNEGEDIDTSGKCDMVNTRNFDECNELLNPGYRCSNSSAAIAADRTNSELLWAVRAIDGNEC